MSAPTPLGYPLLTIVTEAELHSADPFDYQKEKLYLVKSVARIATISRDRNKKSEMTEYFIYEKEDTNFALPVINVLEIVETDQIEDLNIDLYACVGGIVNRQKLVPVFDSVTLGFKQKIKKQNLTTIIIVLCGEVAFGLTMDNFIGVEKLNTNQNFTESTNKQQENKVVSAVVGYKKSTLIIFFPAEISKKVSEKIHDQSLENDPVRINPNRQKTEINKETFKQFLCITIENTNLAIPIEHVREVIEEYEVTPIFSVPELLRGLINLRGNVIACIDISKEIGVEKRPLSMATKFIIISFKDCTIALCADVVHGINDLYLQNIQKPDTVLQEQQQTFVEGIYEEVDKTLLILSISEIFETDVLYDYTDINNVTSLGT